MAFHEQSFQRRFDKMGDQAETVFESVYPQGFARYGLNRPPINLARVPAFVRFQPDYLTAKGLVEVQGFGRDQTAKFKEKKLEALWQWHAIFRVDFFLWDSTNRRYGWVRLAELDAAIGSGVGERREFHEGNQYYAIGADDLPVVGGWTAYGEPLAAAR